MSIITLQQLQSGELARQSPPPHEIRLTHCKLTEFPKELFDFVDTLTLLDLSGNLLDTLPDDLDRFHQLSILFCSNNPFKELPRVLGRCPQLQMIGFKSNQIEVISEEAIPTATLRWLILTDNHLQELPSSLANCHRLQKLMLAGNQLHILPDLSSCHSLELIRLSSNQLESLPLWLKQLPRLAWLAISGNPFTQKVEQRFQQQRPLTEIDASTLRIAQILGEGASGTTYACESDQFPNQALALKVFKHTMTSDGSPDNELLAHQSVGDHPHLTNVVARIDGETDNKQTLSELRLSQSGGMLMKQLAPHLRLLGAPPSLESCSRDIYEATLRLSITQFKQIVLGVTEAVQHLHQRGWLHGDVYAHNTLWSDSEVMLSDLGAASVIPEHAEWLTRIETRAIGVLMDELLLRTPELQAALHPNLFNLAKQLQHPEMKHIPELNEIVEAVNTL